MQLDDISKYKDTHAFLSPSQSSWLRYDEAHLIERYREEDAKAKGTRIHAWAEETILLGYMQPQRTKNMLYNYVNDAIGFRMEPEKFLFHSKYCYGTADSIIFDPRTKTLRIHDLKTGITKPHEDQLKVYAALWCMTNNIEPETIKFICRFYQRNVCIEFKPDPKEIREIMNIIFKFEQILENEDKGGGIIL